MGYVGCTFSRPTLATATAAACCCCSCCCCRRRQDHPEVLPVHIPAGVLRPMRFYEDHKIDIHLAGMMFWLMGGRVSAMRVCSTVDARSCFNDWTITFSPVALSPPAPTDLPRHSRHRLRVVGANLNLVGSFICVKRWLPLISLYSALAERKM